MDGAAFGGAIAVGSARHLRTFETPDLVPALTDGEPHQRAVLHAAADSEAAARDTFAEWAAEEPTPAARVAFEGIAEQERRHLDRVTRTLDDYDPPGAPGTLHASLRGRDRTIGRIAAGMVGRVLVSCRTHERLIEFFDRRDEPTQAALFQELRDETAAIRRDGQRLLESHCETPDDWECATAAARYTIRVAAEEVTPTLNRPDRPPTGSK